MGGGGLSLPPFDLSMGRSSTGGTRSLMRGKVGDSVYQITLNSSGYNVQIVKAAEKSRKYSNTFAQAYARMIMGHLQRFQRAMPDILENCFESVPAGQTAYNLFAQVNHDLLNEQLENYWDEWGEFSWFEKRRLHVPLGPFILSQGSLPQITPESQATSTLNNNYLRLGFGHRGNDWSVRSMFRKADIPESGYFYVILWTYKMKDKDARLDAMRVELKPSISLDADIRNYTSTPLFNIEGYALSQQGFNTSTNRYEITFNYRAVTQYYLIGAWGIVSVGYGARGRQNSTTLMHVNTTLRDLYLWNVPPADVWGTWYDEG